MGGLLKGALTDEERAELTEWHDSGCTSLYIRSRIVWLSEPTGNAAAIARVLAMHEQTACKALHRFEVARLAGIAPRPHSDPILYNGGPGRFFFVKENSSLGVMPQSRVVEASGQSRKIFPGRHFLL
jgi:hypothetical protein